MEEKEERILGWPERYPALFKATAFSTVRNLAVFGLFLLFFLLILTLPEKYWDEHLNHDFYLEELSAFNEKWQSTRGTRQADNAEERQSWFSIRMWNYRYLIYTTHVNKSYDDDMQFDANLADWQSRKLGGKPSITTLHYLYNPGFFWDIGVLLPI